MKIAFVFDPRRGSFQVNAVGTVFARVADIRGVYGDNAVRFSLRDAPSVRCELAYFHDLAQITVSDD